MSSWQCKKRYGNSYSSHGTLCAGSPPDTSLLRDDGCRSNSGGGLLCQEEAGRWVLAGVVAGGNSCGEPSSPSLYTRVSRFRGWMDEVMDPRAEGPHAHANTPDKDMTHTHVEHTHGEGEDNYLHTQGELKHTHGRQETNEITEIRKTPRSHHPQHVNTHTRHTHKADTHTPVGV